MNQKIWKKAKKTQKEAKIQQPFKKTSSKKFIK
jgi:hypothetical protein